MKHLLALLIILTSCSSQMGARATATSQRTLEEARNALFDVKQALVQQQLQLDLLEERVDGRKAEINHTSNALRIENLEATQRLILDDLKQLGTHAKETSCAFTQVKKSLQSLESALNTQSKRLGDVASLKSTLSSISDAIDQSSRTYTVCPGDSLERIARNHNTSVQSIKQANALSSNTILIGQELKIP